MRNNGNGTNNRVLSQSNPNGTFIESAQYLSGGWCSGRKSLICMGGAVLRKGLVQDGSN